MQPNCLIIIPCYNEEDRLPAGEFTTFLKESFNSGVHFLLVNDGSKDKTIEVLEKLSAEFPSVVQVLDLKKNGGKAEAIRQGMLQSVDKKFDYLGYFDADLATPLQEIKRLIEFTDRTPQPYFVMGSRVKLLGSTDIQRKLRRHYIGRVFATIVSNMLRLPIYDTQCGAKLIQTSVVASLFETPFLSKWLFDVELLFRLKRNFKDFETRIVEMPLKKWEDVAGSKIGFSYFLKAPFDLLRIFLNYR